MKSPGLFTKGCLGLLLFISVFSSCAFVDRPMQRERSSIGTEQVISRLTVDIEELYLGWHELNNIYGDIKYQERAFLFAPDDGQLGTIQKVSLSVQDASERIHCQWEQLSVLAFIGPEYLQDYLTLRAKGLTSAIDAVGYDEMFLKIYRNSIEQESVLSDIDRALTWIGKLKGLMQRIRDQLIP